MRLCYNYSMVSHSLHPGYIYTCVCVCVCSVYVSDAGLQVKHGLTLTTPGLASGLASGMICFSSVRAFIEP
jgi:hypothetical protein